ncbi:MAG: copper chaperone [Adhaeribacter sp.]
MKILKFKTNVKSPEAIAEVASFLDKQENISQWKIDAESEENILSVSGENLNPQQVENAVAQAGFKAEVLRVLGTAGEGL